jgi:hypothetical protein
MKEYLLRNEENYQNKNSNPYATDINKENTIKKNESFLKGDEAGFFLNLLFHAITYSMFLTTN